MSIRGLIIAVEAYPALEEGIAAVLPGTLISAERFRDWLIDSKGAAPEDVSFCTDDLDAPGRTAGGSRAAIVGEIHRLQTAGKDATGELYVLLSGHGFGYADIDGVRVADLFVCSDFRKRAISGDAVLKIDALQTYLRLCLGPGDHYYFVDCCRNSLTTGEIKAIDLPLVYDRSRLGQPTVYTLYSTQEGTPAGVASGFGEALLLGLSGAGRAKLWRGAQMAVVFQSLKDFVRSRLPRQPIDGRIEGDGSGVIVAIDPAPTFRCTISVTDAAPADQFEVAVKTIRGQPVGGPRSFLGPVGDFTDVPDDYRVEVTHQGRPISPPAREADLYQDCELRFEKTPPPPTFGSEPLEGIRHTGLVIDAPATSSVRVLQPGAPGEPTLIQPGNQATFTAAGRYEIEVRDRDGIIAERQTFDLEPSHYHELNFSQLRSSRLRDALIQSIPGSHTGGTIDFADSLGPMVDQGLDLWLALLGAAQIVGDSKDSSRLREVPLRSFDQEPPGSQPVFVLAGFDSPHEAVAVGLSLDAKPQWVKPEPVPNVPDLFQVYFPTSAAGDLISFAFANHPVWTVATARLANRATLITLSQGDQGQLRVQQFLLPLRHLVATLPEDIRWRLRLDQPLVTTKRVVQATRQIAARQTLAGLMPDGELYDLLYGKWLDPIMAVFATYELVRRGQASTGDWLKTVLGNLRTYFPELPDVEAIARLADAQPSPVLRAPLVLEGLLGLGPEERPVVLPDDRLDYRGPWTAWLNAVRPPE